MLRNRKYFLGSILISLIFYLWGYFSLQYDFFPAFLIRTAIEYTLGSHRILKSNTTSGGQRLGRSSHIDIIKSIPYLGSAKTLSINNFKAKSFQPAMVFPGYNLYTTGSDDEACLIDNEGRLLHYWKYPREKIIWRSPVELRPKYRGWRSFWPLETLDLFVIYDYLGLARLDKKSRLKWVYKGGCHHDLWITPDGNIYVLGSRHEKEAFYDNRLVVSDYIIVLDLNGHERQRIRLLDLILKSKYRFLLPSSEQLTEPYSLDPLHTNSIQVLDGNLVDKHSELFKKGNILISVRNLSSLFIIDFQKQEIVWAWGPTNISFQHKARLLENGNILLFDNGLKTSRVIELDPISQKIVWQYKGIEEETFFSKLYGAAQRLPNGNTLIILSQQRKAIEVSPQKDIVWTYTLISDDNSNPLVLYELQRYSSDYFINNLFDKY